VSMQWNTESVLTWVLLNVVVGAIWLVLDRKIGEKVFRFGYNFSHRDPLPEGEEIGFLYGHNSLEERFYRASYIAVSQFLIYWWYSHESFATYFLFLVLCIPATFAGIYLGQYIGNPFEFAKKVRSGEVSFDLSGRLKNLRSYLPELSFLRKRTEVKKSEPVVVRPPEEPVIDPHEAIRRFTGEGKGR
jgi:hypothetical protein